MRRKLWVAKACGCSCTLGYLPLDFCPVCRVMPSTDMAGPVLTISCLLTLKWLNHCQFFFLKQIFSFVGFSQWLIIFSLPFFPCLSVLRWTWPIGEFSGVYLSSTQFPFLFLFFLLRLNDMVYTCDTPLLLSNHGWLRRLSPTFALLGSLHWQVSGQ